jgi:hypothetical protein
MWYYLFLILLFEITFHCFKFLQSLCILKSWALAPFELIGAPTAHQTVRYFTHSLALCNLIEVFSKYLLSLLFLGAFSLIKGVKLVVNLERRHYCWGLSLVPTSFVSYLLSFRDRYLLVFMGVRERRGLRFLVSGWIIMSLSWWGWNELPCWLAQELGWDLDVTNKLFIWKIKKVLRVALVVWEIWTCYVHQPWNLPILTVCHQLIKGLCYAWLIILGINVLAVIVLIWIGISTVWS